MINVIVKICNKDLGKFKSRNRELLKVDLLKMISEIRIIEWVRIC